MGTQPDKFVVRRLGCVNTTEALTRWMARPGTGPPTARPRHAHALQYITVAHASALARTPSCDTRLQIAPHPEAGVQSSIFPGTSGQHSSQQAEVGLPAPSHGVSSPQVPFSPGGVSSPELLLCEWLVRTHVLRLPGNELRKPCECAGSSPTSCFPTTTSATSLIIIPLHLNLQVDDVSVTVNLEGEGQPQEDDRRPQRAARRAPDTHLGDSLPQEGPMPGLNRDSDTSSHSGLAKGQCDT
ncbi:uncharacterized protein LOC117025667 [Rhinolophus ferrumequinum]|uniref:uncharacterized protein LOC117025667 n=1 Tax=Rhinolophus ferrumequinum TaxID=59479 RepID=UPI00140FE21C|nr:uncharacterized protein LOC117025667 [Rhinolophus ferrumequinum]